MRGYVEALEALEYEGVANPTHKEIMNEFVNKLPELSDSAKVSVSQDDKKGD